MSNLRGKVVTYLGNLAMDYCTTVTVIADYHTIKTNIKQVKKDKLRKVLCILGEGLDSNINELKRKYKYYSLHKFANIRNENNSAKSKQSKMCTYFVDTLLSILLLNIEKGHKITFEKTETSKHIHVM